MKIEYELLNDNNILCCPLSPPSERRVRGTGVKDGGSPCHSPLRRHHSPHIAPEEVTELMVVRGIGVSDDSKVLDIKNGLHAISVSDLLVVAANHGPVSTETGR